MNKTITRAIAWLGIIVLLASSLVLFSGCLRKENTTTKRNLTIWGTYETSETMNKMINLFLDQQGKNARKLWNISYKKIPLQQGADSDRTYEEILMSEIARGEGPDIFFAHNTWFAKHNGVMLPLYSDPESISIIEQDYVDVISDDLVLGDSLYGVPLYVDTLALYYNPSYFKNTATGRPATTWEGLIEQIPEVEILDDVQGVSTIALGTSNNISRASDIVLNFAQQFGYDDAKEFKKLSLAELGPQKNPLEMYTQFSDRYENAYSWDIDRDYYIDEFINGNVAAIVGYQYLDAEIRAKSSAGFEYEIMELPQVDLRNPVVMANYWAPALSKNAKDPAAAFAFLDFLMNQASGSYLDLTGRAPARYDFITQLQDVDGLGVFARQARIAQSFQVWSLPRYDAVINEVIDDVAMGIVPARSAISIIDVKINSFLRELAFAFNLPFGD